MSVNTMNFAQISTVLTSLVKQVTNQIVETPTNTGEFVSVGQILLRADHDSVLNAISNMVGRTLFSIRQYSAEMTGLEMDIERWGNVTRKLSIADSDWQDDPAYEYPVLFDSTQNPANGDGGRVDPWTIKKPDILQTNFYGSSVYFDEMTITEDQLTTAFESPEKLGSFLTMIMTNLSNRLEQSNEVIRHGLICNAIGAIKAEGNAERNIKLLTEYNGLTGESFTVQDIYHPDNFPAFVKWAFSRVAEVTDQFTKRSEKFQTVVNGKHVIRHTPYEYQKVYLFSPFKRQIDSRVLADAYHDNYLKFSDNEAVSYWQSMKNPSTVNVYPAYTDSNGVLVHDTTSGNNVEVENVLGIVFDRDAMGMTITDRRVLSTPLNTKGLYRNIHVHGKQKTIFDNTEKIAIFTLD